MCTCTCTHTCSPASEIHTHHTMKNMCIFKRQRTVSFHQQLCLHRDVKSCTGIVLELFTPSQAQDPDELLTDGPTGNGK